MRNPFTPFLALLGLWVGLAEPAARAAGNPAGSQIVNQADAAFADPEAGPQTVLSNKVTTVLSAVCNVSVTPKTQQGSYQSGSTVVLPFKVSNAGNNPYTFALSVTNSGFTPSSQKIYLDKGTLGVRDAADVLLSSPEQLALAFDEGQNLLLELGIPAGVSSTLSSALTVSCPGGGSSDSGVATLLPGARLELTKSFSKSSVQPGDRVTVTLTVRNAGGVDAQNLTVQDLFKNTLNTPTQTNFALVPGSALPSSGFFEVAGGVEWRVPTLERQKSLTLSFDLQAQAVTELGTKTNVATVKGEGVGGTPLAPAKASAPITLRAPPRIALGPGGNPEAPELSAADRQEQSQAILGNEICFQHSLKNLGPDPDSLTVVLETARKGSVSASFRSKQGGPLNFPVTVEAGETFDFLVCYTSLGSEPFEVVLIATSSRGAAPNRTVDAVAKIIVPGVALGPVNNPEAPELSETDTQTQPLAVLGQAICFEHTLKNTGNAPDSYTLDSSFIVGAATVEFKIAQPILLEPGASVSFTVCYTPKQAGPLEVILAATSKYGPTNQTRDRVLEVNTPEIALGPVGNPRANPGGEGSASDLQTRMNALLNQQICFEHTVENLAKVPDEITLAADITAGTASYTLLNLDGTPLLMAIKLAAQGQPGDRFSFHICYTPTVAGSGALALEGTLTATSKLGAKPNLTRDQIQKLYSGLPILVKSVSQDSAKPIKQGETLSYTLTVTNPFPFALTGITVTDLLSEYLDLGTVQLSSGGVLSGSSAVWTLDRLEPSARVTLTVSAQVKQDAPDAVKVVNRFTFSSGEVSTPAPSNEVTTLVWSASLTLEKKADVAQVDLGGELGWTLRIFNTSKNASLVQLTLEDTLPAGLSYVPGSAKLDGKVIADPTVSGQKLSFSLPNPIAAQATAVLTFHTRVGVDAPELLVNSAQVSGKGQDSATTTLTAVASNVAKSQVVRVNPRVFGATGELLGRVYLDVNRDGAFSFSQDLPQGGVRLILADGRSVLTDTEGRYHFQSLSEGMWGLRLDPNSVPFRAAPEVNDGGKRGSRNMNVFALTVADFPLELPLGSVYACRSTTLRVGEVSLEKSILRLSQNTYRVTLTLSTPTALEKLSITDPLPMGATLLEGTGNFLGDVTSGTRSFVYTFSLPRDGSLARDGLPTLTDPEMGWSYP